MKKQIIVFGIILIVAVWGVASYMTNPEIQEKVASYTEENFSEGNIYSDLTSLSRRLDEEIMKGSESFTVYLKDMNISEIDQINDSLDGVFGSGSTYQQVGMVGNTYKKVTITIKRTTNYYALQAYVNQEPIPDTEQKAKQLYQVVRQIMATYIDDTMTDFEKEVALHDYLVKNCKYSQDTQQPPGSDIYRAYGALVNKDAVCNGYAEALQLLFRCAGIESEFVIGTADGIDHAWNLVQLDGAWYHVDATWNDPMPDQSGVSVHSYFNVTDEIMSQSHEWKKENYPEAYSMNYNYYVYNNLYFGNFNEYKTKAYEVMIGEHQNRFEAMMRSYQENEEDMQFIFEGNTIYNSVNWQTFQAGKNCVLVLEAE